MGPLSGRAPLTGPRPGAALIQFTCDRPDHAKRNERYTLTIHDGQWAFCGHEGPTSEHTWRPVAGVKLDQVLERRRPR
jgi:hypothetical protein